MQKQDSLRLFRLSCFCLILAHPSTTSSAEFTSGSHARFEPALILGGVAIRRGLLTPQIIKSILQVFSLFLQV